MYSETGANFPCRLLFSCQIKGIAENTANAHTVHHAIHCISYGLLRASHLRNPTGDRLRRSVAAFAPPLHTLCERMWLTARAYSHFRAACASLRAHTCCLRNRIQSLTHASRVTILSAFSKSLYSKEIFLLRDHRSLLWTVSTAAEGGSLFCVNRSWRFSGLCGMI